jgi:hypothetical protein
MPTRGSHQSLIPRIVIRRTETRRIYRRACANWLLFAIS